jgi:hypothetical protein
LVPFSVLPGAFKIAKVTRADQLDKVIPVVSFERVLLDAGDRRVTPSDVAFSSLQSITAVLEDGVTDFTNLEVGSTVHYSVSVLGIPQLGRIQAALDDNEAADVLALAAYPVFCSVEMSLDREVDSTTVDAAKAAVAEIINSSDVGQTSVPVSLITAKVNAITGATVVGAVNFYVRGLTANGEHSEVHQLGAYVPKTMNSIRRVSAFYCDAADVNISV